MSLSLPISPSLRYSDEKRPRSSIVFPISPSLRYSEEKGSGDEEPSTKKITRSQELPSTTQSIFRSTHSLSAPEHSPFQKRAELSPVQTPNKTARIFPSFNINLFAETVPIKNKRSTPQPFGKKKPKRSRTEPLVSSTKNIDSHLPRFHRGGSRMVCCVVIALSMRFGG